MIFLYSGEKNEDFKTFFKLHRSKKSPTANYNEALLKCFPIFFKEGNRQFYK